VESTALVRVEAEARPLTANQVVSQVRLIQQVMEDVMKEGTHYGRIPGMPMAAKPALFKPGAEKLAATFRLALDPQIEDLSSGETIRYRIRCVVTAQATGTFLGAGVGEASSDEEKYRWRKASCQEEWDDTPQDRRRKKWAKGDSGPYCIIQVRMNPADIANTILKMADKRASVSGILKVTAASDLFEQDIEDLPPEVQEEVVAKTPKPPPPPPKEKLRAPSELVASAPAAAEAVSQEAAPENVEEDRGANEWTGVIRFADLKVGKKKSGEDWSAWFVKGDGDMKFSTFSKTLGDSCVRLKGREVFITYDSDGKYNTIKSIQSFEKE
jgi:hypothetical protein